MEQPISNNGNDKRIAERRPSLAVNDVAPVFTVPRLDMLGEVSLEDIPGKRLLVIVKPGCPGCGIVMGRLSSVQADHPDITIVMITSGSYAANLKKFGDVSELPFIGVQPKDMSVSRDYAIRWWPWSVLIDETGRLADDSGQAVMKLIPQGTMISPPQLISKPEEVWFLIRPEVRLVTKPELILPKAEPAFPPVPPVISPLAAAHDMRFQAAMAREEKSELVVAKGAIPRTLANPERREFVKKAAMILAAVGLGPLIPKTAHAACDCFGSGPYDPWWHYCSWKGLTLRVPASRIDLEACPLGQRIQWHDPALGVTWDYDTGQCGREGFSFPSYYANYVPFWYCCADHDYFYDRCDLTQEFADAWIGRCTENLCHTYYDPLLPYDPAFQFALDDCIFFGQSYMWTLRGVGWLAYEAAQSTYCACGPQQECPRRPVLNIPWAYDCPGGVDCGDYYEADQYCWFPFPIEMGREIAKCRGGWVHGQWDFRVAIQDLWCFNTFDCWPGQEPEDGPWINQGIVAVCVRSCCGSSGWSWAPVVCGYIERWE